MQEKKWRLRKKQEQQKVQALQESLNVDLFIAELLVQRGIDDFESAKQFFRPSLNDLHDPFLMADMNKAVKRVVSAIHNQEKILVYGDYDVDGTTSVAMMHSFLQQLGLHTSYYIPHRYKEGYGVSQEGIAFAKSEKCSLLITLDCGIKAHDRIQEAQYAGIDVIVCDHHKPGEQLPPAFAVLDPVRSDCNYPYKGLSGCGVGFKFIQAICQDQGFEDQMWLQFLDLLTISIGADIVPITGENRLLAHYGLKTFQGPHRPGIAAMFESASFQKKNITISDVVFTLAPRINAAGRMDSAELALELLLSDSPEKACEISARIEDYNTNRRQFDKDIAEAALQQINDDPWYSTSWSTVVFGSDWHKGVIGIVASRLIESFYKPTIVFTEKDGILSGSARSIEGLDIHETLSDCAELLIQFGGHAMAAGMTMKLENYEAFRRKFEQAVRSRISEEDLVPVIEIDQELPFDQITTSSYKILKQFAPFGPENMKPVFLAKGCVDTSFSKVVGNDRTHLKLHVIQKSGRRDMQGIGFKLGHHLSSLKDPDGVDLVYTLEENEWRDQVTLQINVQDIHLANAETITEPEQIH